MISAFTPQRSKCETLQDILCHIDPEPSTMVTIPYVDPMVKLKHVLEHVLTLPSNSALEMAIIQNSLSSIDDVLANNNEALAALTIRDGFTTVKKMEDGSTPKKRGMTTQNLLPGMITHVSNLHQMQTYCIEQLDPIADWTMITWTGYINFMRTILPVYKGTASTPIPPPAKLPTSVVPSYQKDPLAEFKKGIKCDPSQFQMLSDFKDWDSFFRSFMIEAKAQGLSNVINPTYRPSTDEERSLFAFRMSSCFRSSTRSSRPTRPRKPCDSIARPSMQRRRFLLKSQPTPSKALLPRLILNASSST